MRILVTGGAGFIGSHTAERLLALGHTVAIIDDFNDYYDPSFKRENAAILKRNPACSIREGDISNLKTVRQVFDEAKPEMVIHLAARAGVRPSVRDPLLYQKVNVEGTLNLLECLRQNGIRKMTFGSTSSIYGLNTKVPFSEDDPVPNIASPYAATKLAGEALCRSYSHLFGIDMAVLRFFTVYGPRGRPDMAMYQFSQKITKGETIEVYGDGSSRRDYTYVDDIVQGVAATVDRKFGFEIFNLGESETTVLMELIGLLEKSLGAKAKVRHLPDQPGDVPQTFADTRKARQMLGYKPQTKVPAGIPKFIAWMKEHKRL
jgi:UDP-glucuronate 4-epimerase